MYFRKTKKAGRKHSREGVYRKNTFLKVSVKNQSKKYDFSSWLVIRNFRIENVRWTNSPGLCFKTANGITVVLG